MGAHGEDFSIHVPYELEAGEYASLLHVSYTAHEFTLDFCSPIPSGESEYRLVSRLRVPVTVLFDLLRILNRELSRYEQAFGEIRRPDDR